MIANLPPWDSEENEKKRLHTSDTPHHPPAMLDAVARAWVDERAAEAYAVGVITTAPRSGPIAPEGSTVADQRTMHEAGIDEVVWI